MTKSYRLSGLSHLSGSISLLPDTYVFYFLKIIKIIKVRGTTSTTVTIKDLQALHDTTSTNYQGLTSDS